jgi:TAG lipase/lysophosphatidylethanolamine acyltransferase
MPRNGQLEDMNNGKNSMLAKPRAIALELVYLSFDIAYSWYSSLYTSLVGRDPVVLLKERLGQAASYDEWRATCEELDLHQGNDVWRANPVSSIYDHKLIYFRLQHLRRVREMGDVTSLFFTLRSGLLRNLGGLNDIRLYKKSLLGTKNLIESYTDEVVDSLEFLANHDFQEFSNQAKLEFFNDTKQSFGHTALLLQGGATFGMAHLGVVKTLHEQELLPRIISGTSVGALMAAFVGIHTDQELPDLFSRGGINLQAFARVGLKGNMRRKIVRFLKHGYLMDVKVLEDCVRANVGDLTFEEAFLRSKRVLNIVVSSSRTNEVPRLLNYLTAPNVLVWSAAVASLAGVGLYEPVHLLAKDKAGNIVTWSSQPINWNDASFEQESPEMRLAELFNVNHYIVSMASPFSPVPSKERVDTPIRETFLSKMRGLVTSEIRHRFNQLDQLGLVPRMMSGAFSEKFKGHITIPIVPATEDFSTMFSNPTYISMSYWQRKGELATWPYLAVIRNRVAIEITLDLVLAKVRAKMAK